MFRAALTWIWGTWMNSSHSGLERPVESIRSRSHCPSHRCRISSDQSSLPVIAIEVLVLRSAPLAPLQMIWRNANRRHEGSHVLFVPVHLNTLLHPASYAPSSPSRSFSIRYDFCRMRRLYKRCTVRATSLPLPSSCPALRFQSSC